MMTGMATQQRLFFTPDRFSEDKIGIAGGFGEHRGFFGCVMVRRSGIKMGGHGASLLSAMID